MHVWEGGMDGGSEREEWKERKEWKESKEWHNCAAYAEQFFLWQQISIPLIILIISILLRVHGSFVCKPGYLEREARG